MNRDEAMALLREYTKNENLIKHALAVEAAMRHYAELFGGDPDRWGIVGLLHDFDYERYPTAEDHPLRGAEILQAKGYPDDVIYAIKAHAEYLGLERKSPMDKALFAVDELTGFIVAVALVRPSKSLHEVTVKSVKKKMKDKAFARAVKREDFITGAEELELSLEEHIDHVIRAMQDIADELGLA